MASSRACRRFPARTSIIAAEQDPPITPAAWIPDGTFPASYEQIRHDRAARYRFPSGWHPPTAA